MEVKWLKTEEGDSPAFHYLLPIPTTHWTLSFGGYAAPLPQAIIFMVISTASDAATELQFAFKSGLSQSGRVLAALPRLSAALSR
jgi:hypothetical protein